MKILSVFLRRLKLEVKKWLLSGSHNLKRHNILWHLVVIGKAVDDLGCII